MTLFGDLDVSTLREGPLGRQPVHTYFVEEPQRQRWWDFFCKKLLEGRQGYVIAPLVGLDGAEDTTGVEQLYEALVNGPLDAFRVEILHGRLSNSEKERVMREFRRGSVQVLVATTVVEVGVDVPNATVMTIEGADCFGLAQLHQLRGRVGRGEHPGFVAAFADQPNEEARQRLAAFTSTNDGFELAEVDFRLRGPGELLGTKQHGLPPLRIADLVRDAQVLETARRDAFKMIEADPELRDPHFVRLRRMVLIRYGDAMELGDVG